MKAKQMNLFGEIGSRDRQPLILAYGLGVDSTAVLVELQKRGIRPDAILFADTGNEKQKTYDYLPIIDSWLASVGFPQVTVVRYKPKSFKNFPPYSTLGEQCLATGTLPSLAFGYKACSLKWKVVPQNIWTDHWDLARKCWSCEGRVKKIIGYDASPKDMKRYAHVKNLDDPKYEYWYPLIEWKMDREACKTAIRNAGLPIPPKSACTFCPATQPSELHDFRKEYLRLIVLMEALARPRLQGCMSEEQLYHDYVTRHAIWEEKTARYRGPQLKKLLQKEPKLKSVGSGTAGLWRSRTDKRPAMMTDYILANGLLSASEIDIISKDAVLESKKRHLDYLSGLEILNWHDFLEMFSEEDAIDELGHNCSTCRFH